MAQNTGTATFPGGTGAKSLNIGMTATWMEIHFTGSTIKPSDGFVYGGNQYALSDPNSTATSGTAIQVRNTSGTVILEGTWTNFSGTQANFNITTQTGSVPQMLLVFGN